ncbi:hypothetical protein FB45DRAFT_1064476 [Roridomyces roridus]|uniref:Uncharacterized protein n=1 Tax=Roridomyces roridus TaxID=1738132 RepID=A0AAD7FEZ8_9AGAR|nr:hypothetical protein FB45DRAFT_1064476 [Roridomyces roridus]
MKRNKAESKTLADRAAQVVLDISGQTKDLSTQLPPEVERCIHEIETFLQEIEEFFRELEKERFLRRFVRQDRHRAQIEEYGRLLDQATAQFSMNLQLSIQTAQLDLRSAQVAQIAADEKRHGDVLTVSQMSEAERLQLLTSLDGMYPSLRCSSESILIETHSYLRTAYPRSGVV